MLSSNCDILITLVNIILTFHLVGAGRVFQKDCVNKQDSSALVQKGSPMYPSFIYSWKMYYSVLAAQGSKETNQFESSF